MLNVGLTNYRLSGTKAETLLELIKIGYNVPEVHYFTVVDWGANKEVLLDKIVSRFKGKLLAVRSSACAEDSAESSMAGAFDSLLNIKAERDTLSNAIDRVIKSYDGNPLNQVLIQPMVARVAMSGVVMSQVLDDGSPYHVINYDDSTGLTDTVTSGSTINKTVYIYNGADEKDFDSPYLVQALKLVRSLQETFKGIPLDIEFIVDEDQVTHLVQVRRITTFKTWKSEINDKVSERISFLKHYVSKSMRRRPQLYGDRTLFGFMPDWNPAEMIGMVPHPLSMSLYRELITSSTWRIAREKMGYRKMPNVDLMVSLFGRAYIDVRNSFNSFLPANLPDEIGEKLINAFLDRLDKRPQLHDKVEFEVVPTAFDLDFDIKFHQRYSGVLTDEEFYLYRSLLRKITKEALRDDYNGSINKALRNIEKLRQLQEKEDFDSFARNTFSIADTINTLIGECVELGTLPFSILARHGFIAEGFLRSAVSKGAIAEERIQEFRRSFKTVAGEMSEDFQSVFRNEITQEEYLKKYGHLRPSSYDIMSPNYNNRADLFNGDIQPSSHVFEPFELTREEERNLNIILGKNGMDGVDAKSLFRYAEKAIKGREYAKFVFTKHLSSILEFVAEWGEQKGFTREDMSMLPIQELLNILFEPLTDDLISYYKQRIAEARRNYEIGQSFKLSYLLRSVRDVYIVPMQRSAANFIGNQRLEGDVVVLTPYQKSTPELAGKIICIEGADPGYDWIFTRNIAGLITKFGGANSHMAIRSAEYNIPAAIGCGEQPYQRIVNAKKCLLDCQGKRLEPLDLL